MNKVLKKVLDKVNFDIIYLDNGVYTGLWILLNNYRDDDGVWDDAATWTD